MIDVVKQLFYCVQDGNLVTTRERCAWNCANNSCEMKEKCIRKIQQSNDVVSKCNTLLVNGQPSKPMMKIIEELKNDPVYN